jgi:hypothetical protein
VSLFIGCKSMKVVEGWWGNVRNLIGGNVEGKAQ